MNATIKQILINVGISAVVALIIVGLMGGKSIAQLGAQVQNDLFYFSRGVKVGNSAQFAVDNSGNLTTSGTATFSGKVTGIATSTLSTLTVSGATVLTGKLTANNIINTFGTVASSTVQVGAASKAGCLILGDSADAASVVYIIASGSTLTASTTKPVACQTAL